MRGSGPRREGLTRDHGAPAIRGWEGGDRSSCRACIGEGSSPPGTDCFCPSGGHERSTSRSRPSRERERGSGMRRGLCVRTRSKDQEQDATRRESCSPLIRDPIEHTSGRRQPVEGWDCERRPISNDLRFRRGSTDFHTHLPRWTVVRGKGPFAPRDLGTRNLMSSRLLRRLRWGARGTCEPSGQATHRHSREAIRLSSRQRNPLCPETSLGGRLVRELAPPSEFQPLHAPLGRGGENQLIHPEGFDPGS